MAKELSMESVHLSGHLHALWHRCLEQQEDGDLSDWGPELISEMAEFRGDPELFVNLLKKFRWLEKNFLIHDWLDYAGRYLISKYRNSNPKKLKEIFKKHKRVYRPSKGNPKDDQMGFSPVGIGKGILSEKKEGGLGGDDQLAAVRDFQIFWDAEFRSRWGTAYTFAAGREFQLLHDLLSRISFDEIKSRAVKFLSSEDPWLKHKKNISMFATKFDTIPQWENGESREQRSREWEDLLEKERAKLKQKGART